MKRGLISRVCDDGYFIQSDDASKGLLWVPQERLIGPSDFVEAFSPVLYVSPSRYAQVHNNARRVPLAVPESAYWSLLDRIVPDYLIRQVFATP
tara:strand:+ start:1426 stop:1707 length:282 start_codon:yes stop_codon:yes gene_type:complete